MKINITSLLVAFGLFTNAALAGNSAKIGYASDFFYRGAQKSLESVQAAVDLESQLFGLNGSLHACTNQSIDGGSDSYKIAAGLGTSLSDLFSVYGGFNHFEDVAGEALSEIELRLFVDMVGSPTISAFRDTDDDLYTFEGALSHSIKTNVADVTLRGLMGNTELAASTDRTYYSAGTELSKSVGDKATLAASVDVVDADDIDREFVFGTSLTFEF